METTISILIGFMILGALFALHARDLLSALIAQGIVGYSLVICFLLLSAPDLAIVQIVVETITLIIMVAVVLNSTRELRIEKPGPKRIATLSFALLLVLATGVFFSRAIEGLAPFGQAVTGMSSFYLDHGAASTGSANLVTGVLFDFRAYDTFGEATILFTAAMGVLTILRIKSRKEAA